jgi:integrase/recombinase XerD
MNQGNLVIIEECFRKAKVIGKPCASSLIKYNSSIKKFLSIIPKNIEDLELRDFEDFIIKMREGKRPASNLQIAHIISAVKWLIKKAQDEGLISKSLDLNTVRRPKIEQKEQGYLTEEEIRMFFDCIQKDMQTNGEIIRIVRFRALIELWLQTGCRHEEALSINIGKIDWQNSEIPIIGKGEKPRTLKLRKPTILWLKKYLSVRKGENEALFVTLDGKNRWQQTDVGRSFRRYRDMSGIKKDFTPHTLRRTLATLLFHRGVGPEKIQLVMGHERLETTVKHYLKAAQQKVVSEIMMKDELFDFIPESALEANESVLT